MAKAPTGKSANASRASVGTTYDGVRVLKPKTKPVNFTTVELRAILSQALKKSADSGLKRKAGNILVERQADGQYAVERQNAKRASAKTKTQAAAIARADEIAPDKSPIVRRVKNTKAGKRGQFRKA